MANSHNVIRNLNSSSMKTSLPFIIIVIVLALVIGIGTGYGINKVTNKSESSMSTGSGDSLESVKTEKAAGIKDTKTFPDTAEGIMREGGIEGEGSFHLERPGGKSQNVYLTSSTVDLSEFIGKKVKVWGATQTAEKAGWLMDVGFVEVQ